jgi:tRNA pseudouridine38-40 synthase
MKTIRLTIEYDGTDFVGWQWQANGISVQQVLEAALAQILGQAVRVTSSGRTDAGVHARGMVVHFQTERELPLTAYREGVNAHLPPDVAVREAAVAGPDFHARFDARGKWYRYTICQTPVRLPLVARTSWQLGCALDEEAMRQAAAILVGRHDFAAFRASGCAAVSTVREIFSLEILRQENLLYIDVRGSGFLRNMVRILVGTLVEIGRGKMPLAELRRLLREGVRKGAGPTAPAQGLCLMEVWY